MFKKILVVALLALPLGIFAQDKIAYVSMQEIIHEMPEYKALMVEIENEEKQMTSELRTLEEELERKYKAYAEQQDTLIESIRTRRITEIQELQQRTEGYRRDSQQLLQTKYNEKQAPIYQKFIDAIKAVGEENGYAYVMEKGTFIFIAPTSVDATPLVRKKLGLQ